MSAGVDLSQFFDTFFDEAEELLADMERQLIELNPQDPAMDQLNAIFRAAHSIKGGASTFGCFQALAQTTHLLENVLDLIRKEEMRLNENMVDLFLETKDVLTDQVIAYRNTQEPDAEVYERICAQLQALALADGESGPQPGVAPEANGRTGREPEAGAPRQQPLQPVGAKADGVPTAGRALPLCVRISSINTADADALVAEMALLGTILHRESSAGALTLWLETSASPDDVSAVCCFVINADQIQTGYEAVPEDSAPQQVGGQTLDADVREDSPDGTGSAARNNASGGTVRKAAEQPYAGTASGGTLRVGVEKVDQIINLVGELVITQSMLVQTSSALDPVEHDRLLNGIEQLERNARDLQEAVMSIRMVPMDYVFSRFPRVVREAASRLGKRIRLTTKGQATELDKSLIERIIDPLTHLVRNSIDHGIEPPERRSALGKDPEGNLLLAAQHHGGQIIIEVSDDGGGLDRERILRKAQSQGMAVSETMSDEDVWQLIFAPGFSTAEQVTDISGRGVGMDVVRRNIQAMGGHIQLASRPGLGTTTRIILPLTLAILDGMSVGVGAETFILPLSHVTESMQPSADQVHRLSDAEQMLFVRGEYLPLVPLHDVFSVENAERDITRSIAVIVQAEDTRFALQVDHLIGQHQVVVKNLEANYRKIPGVSAATILGDGSVALIVDVFALMRFTRDKSAH
ncbi:chemotaxis protein CheA [Allopusillimonas soli]|uniref:Chemotaxis protein CheA n=1 Tax=Allopusillimonas soli TaxID=659016 RepID=A0A853F6D6_9BURK|nr:chemotaxis protein CheA [Allopusillimonas soli]NYT35539.1 chemotaxis protein CheA [Allopusillimonas soli]TEA75944.1 chemotaxis protein CheA [Allopusillimonas soli]